MSYRTVAIKDLLKDPAYKIQRFVESNFTEVINWRDHLQLERLLPNEQVKPNTKRRFKFPKHNDRNFIRRAWLKVSLDALSASGETDGPRLQEHGLLSLIRHLRIFSGNHEIVACDALNLRHNLTQGTKTDEWENLVANQIGWEAVEGTRDTNAGGTQVFFLNLANVFTMFARCFPLFLMRSESLELEVEFADKTVVQGDGTIAELSFTESENELIVEYFDDAELANALYSFYIRDGIPFYYENNYITEDSQSKAAPRKTVSKLIISTTNGSLRSTSQCNWILMRIPSSSLTEKSPTGNCLIDPPESIIRTRISS